MNGYSDFPRFVNGRGLSRRKLSPNMRARLVADILDGVVEFKPSQTQLCDIFSASSAKVREVRAYGNGAAGNGHAEPANGNGGDAGPTYGNGNGDITDEAIFEYVQDIGVARVWDAIVKVIS